MSVRNYNTSLVSTDFIFNKISFFSADAYIYLQNVPKTDDISRLVFIRHGESTSNKEKSMAGRTLDADLSPNGIEQATAAGEALKKIGFSASVIYSSPMKRTVQTGKYILGVGQSNLFKQLLTCERLHERYYGPFEGASEKKYAPIKELDEIQNSGRHKSFLEKFKFKPIPEMESMCEVYNRMADFIRAEHTKKPGLQGLVLTHNAGMKALVMAEAAQKGYDLEYRAFDLGNCSVVVVEVDKRSFHVVATKGIKFRPSYKPTTNLIKSKL